MNEQTIPGMDVAILPNGVKIKQGDSIKYKTGAGHGITKVVINDGKLCMENNFLYGPNMPIDLFLKNAGYNEIEKIDQ